MGAIEASKPSKLTIHCDIILQPESNLLYLKVSKGFVYFLVSTVMNMIAILAFKLCNVPSCVTS